MYKDKDIHLPEKLNYLFFNLLLKQPLNSIFIKGEYKKYKFHKLYNHLSSVYLLFDEIVNEINNLNSIQCRDQIVNLINNIYIINEGLGTLVKAINDNFILFDDKKILLDEKNEKLFYKTWQNFWVTKIPTKEFTEDIKEILSSDDAFFEYLRSLVVHPFKTNRHPVAKNNRNELFFKYLKEQSAPIIKFYKSTDKKDQIVEIRIYKLKPTDKEIIDNYLSINVSLNSIKRYARNKYIKLEKIIKWLNNCRKFIIKSLNHKRKWSKDNLVFINQYIEVMQEKYLDTHFFEIFREKYLFFLKGNLVNKINIPLIEEYFSTLFKLLRNNINKLEYYNYNKLYDLYEIIDIAWMYKKFNEFISVDDISKVNIYLKGERHGAMPKYKPYDEDVTNKEIFLGVINDFYIKVAHKYISMNIEDLNLSFLEIRLLLDVSIYKLSQDNK